MQVQNYKQRRQEQTKNTHTHTQKKTTTKQKNCPCERNMFQSQNAKPVRSNANYSLYIRPSRGRTNNVVSEQVRHKSGCTVTEAG